VQFSDREQENTYIAHTRRRPTTTLGETLDAEPVGLGMGTTFFPGIDTTGPELHAFIGIEPTSDHPENALLDSIEYFVGIVY